MRGTSANRSGLWVEARIALGLDNQSVAAPLFGYSAGSRISEIEARDKDVPAAVARLMAAVDAGCQ